MSQNQDAPVDLADKFKYIVGSKENIGQLNDAISILEKSFSADQPDQFFSNKLSLKALNFFGKIMAYEYKNVDYKKHVENKTDLVKFFINLMSYFYEIRHQLDFSDQSVNMADFYSTSDMKQVLTLTFRHCLYITNLIFPRHVWFIKAYLKLGGHKTYFGFLSDEEFLIKHKDLDLIIWNGRTISILRYLLLNTNTFSKHANDYKQDWIDSKMVDRLLRISEIRSDFSYNAHLCITNIVDDKQIEQLDQIHAFAKELADYLTTLNQMFQKNTIKRDKYQVQMSSQDITVDVCFLYDSIRKTNVMINTILDPLYKLSINNMMKKELYYELNCKELLRPFVSKGTEFEIRETVRILAQFSFDPEIAVDLKNYSEYMDLLSKRLDANFKPSEDSNVRLIEQEIYNMCQQLRWNIDSVKIEKPVSQSNEDQRHVMISYNTGSREICLRIKNDLESNGYRVWMDVSDIHGSSLDSMAKAVENSYCVLMCITEKYRQSVNCQSEAQYAYKLGRPIIPCILQKGYENVTGWLGMIMGDKIFVNFMKYEFAECTRRLRNEVNQYYKGAKSVESGVKSGGSGPQDTPPLQSKKDSSVKTKEILTWDKKKCNEWMIEKNVSKIIIDKIGADCDGEVLDQFYQMKNSAPQFFYQTFFELADHDVCAMSKFASSLANLFSS